MHLSGLYVYPIKSMPGIAVREGVVGRTGLRHDRRWMLVDERGRFISQRTEPRLGQAEVTWGDGGYRVRVPAGTLTVPEVHDGPRVPVSVWRSSVHAVVHREGGALMSRWLGRPLRLVYLPDDVVRPAGRHASPGDRVSFADGYPYLLLGEASVADVGARVGGPPMAMARFRPNLVVAGSEPYQEDGWARLTIGGLAFRGVKRCTRCVMITLDPETGERGPEPLRTLATYRCEDGAVRLGMNLVADDEGPLRVGADVRPEPPRG